MTCVIFCWGGGYEKSAPASGFTCLRRGAVTTTTSVPLPGTFEPVDGGHFTSHLVAVVSGVTQWLPCWIHFVRCWTWLKVPETHRKLMICQTDSSIETYIETTNQWYNQLQPIASTKTFASWSSSLRWESGLPRSKWERQQSWVLLCATGHWKSGALQSSVCKHSSPVGNWQVSVTREQGDVLHISLHWLCSCEIKLAFLLIFSGQVTVHYMCTCACTYKVNEGWILKIGTNWFRPRRAA